MSIVSIAILSNFAYQNHNAKMKRTRYILFSIFVFHAIIGFAQDITGGLVLENLTHQPVIGASITLAETKNVVAITDMNGRFAAKNINGKTIRISYIGFKPLVAKATKDATYYLVEDTNALAEVVVTAQESRGLASASTIGKKAMEHLQPSTFSDLLELLPGGRSADPSLNNPNSIRLREAASNSGANYATSSLGTSFVIDGAPVSNNANMQYMKGAWDTPVTNRDFTNKGIDMRTISTDDIEKVEIVRGIPSVEYGDLTTGLVKIERRRGGSNLSARLKADMSSKLFYLAKGFEFGKRWTLNISADYLDANRDPRNSLERYSRVTFSARSGATWIKNNYTLKWTNNFDYGGSFDGEKLDPDLNKGKIDTYKSKYNRFAFNTALNVAFKHRLWLKSVNATFSSSYQHDVISRTRLVQLSQMTPAVTTTEEGEYNVPILPYTYYGTQDVDGKPLNIFAQLNAKLQVPSTIIANTLLVGASWTLDKNYGDGQIFDPLRPPYTGISVRQRKLSTIPAMSTLAVYAEEQLRIPFARHTFELNGGIRASQMLNLPTSYTMHGHWYFDPRMNLGWSFPQFKIGKWATNVRIQGGVGQHTKNPTMEYLYPDPRYLDIVQLSYYHPNNDYRVINVRTFVIDTTNKALKPARNLKWEFGTDINIAGNNLSVTYFKENMTSGFRSNTVYRPYTFKQYDTSGIDPNSITAAPDVATLPFTMVQELFGRNEYTNGSQTLKRGIEYTFATRRIPSLHTRLTVNGAWFRTIYRNSQVVAYRPSAVIDNKQIQYVGLYRDNDGVKNEMANTNFTFDTDIPKLRLGFSLSAQCLWFSSTQRLPLSNEPDQYISPDGTIHDWQKEYANDTYLRFLVRNHSAVEYKKYIVPFSMNLNLKVTKKLLNDRLNIAMFCNRILDYTPDYEQNGIKIRRSVRPYFGLEINAKL